jgi:hypothetical protein
MTVRVNGNMQHCAVGQQVYDTENTTRCIRIKLKYTDTPLHCWSVS